LKNNNNFNKTAGNVSGGLISLLPLILLTVGGIYLYKWVKNSGGISSLFSSLIGVEKPGSDISKEKSEQAFDKIQTILKGKSLTPNALHTSKANQIFDLFNQFSSTAFSSKLPDKTQKEILSIYANVPYIADRALIYTEYGTRRANNRQSTWLGFLWDDPTGDLRQHASRYMDGENASKMIAYIDGATKAYLT
jgi:hypothetical protein